METLKTDVLVIGRGGAGMQAALAAREEGAEVGLVSKTPRGKPTCYFPRRFRSARARAEEGIFSCKGPKMG